MNSKSWLPFLLLLLLAIGAVVSTAYITIYKGEVPILPPSEDTEESDETETTESEHDASNEAGIEMKVLIEDAPL